MENVVLANNAAYTAKINEFTQLLQNKQADITTMGMEYHAVCTALTHATKEAKRLKDTAEMYTSFMSNMLQKDNAAYLVEYMTHMQNTVSTLENYSKEYLKKSSAMETNYAALVDIHAKNTSLTNDHSSLLVRYADIWEKKLRSECVMTVAKELSSEIDDASQQKDIAQLTQDLFNINQEIADLVDKQSTYKRQIFTIEQEIKVSNNTLAASRRAFLDELAYSKRALKEFHKNWDEQQDNAPLTTTTQTIAIRKTSLSPNLQASNPEFNYPVSQMQYTSPNLTKQIQHDMITNTTYDTDTHVPVREEVD